MLPRPVSANRPSGMLLFSASSTSVADPCSSVSGVFLFHQTKPHSRECLAQEAGAIRHDVTYEDFVYVATANGTLKKMKYVSGLQRLHVHRCGRGRLPAEAVLAAKHSFPALNIYKQWIGRIRPAAQGLLSLVQQRHLGRLYKAWPLEESSTVYVSTVSTHSYTRHDVYPRIVLNTCLYGGTGMQPCRRILSERKPTQEWAALLAHF